MDLASQAATVGALADPTRLALYEYVAGRPGPVGREEASAALGIPLHTAKFHLDRLVEAGLMTTEFRRLGGRSGPGAGRPSKLYRRVDDEVAVSLPARRYDLAGHLLAAAVERAAAGVPLAEALSEVSREAGRQAGEARAPGDLAEVGAALAGLGFEPREEDDALTLANCPFDALAQQHTALVCGLNQSFVQGVVDGVECAADACLEPEPGQCCVRVRRSS